MNTVIRLENGTHSSRSPLSWRFEDFQGTKYGSEQALVVTAHVSCSWQARRNDASHELMLLTVNTFGERHTNSRRSRFQGY
jgi:hypothetical protein